MEKETPTHKQIIEQFREGKKPSVLIKRSDGTIQPAVIEHTQDPYGPYVAHFEEGSKSIAFANLSDQRQWKLAQELSGKREVVGGKWVVPKKIGETALTQNMKDGLGPTASDEGLVQPVGVDKV